MSARAGLNAFKINGEIFDVRGDITYSLGKRQREAVVGADRVHGYREFPTVPFFELEFSDAGNLNEDVLSDIEDATITAELVNGKVIALRNAWSVNPDGFSGGTEQGNLSVRFEGLSCEVIRE